MARHRLGVVLPLPEPVAAAVDTLRQALGVTDLDRIPPHLTLIPPINVSADRLDEAVARVESAAAASSALRLTLGPAVTFTPPTSVLFLAVGEAATVDALARLREALWQPPYDRPTKRPFVPHVTLAEHLDEEHLGASLLAFAHVRATAVIEVVHLWEEHRLDDGRRVWRPHHEARLGPPSTVARGGLPVTLAVSARLPADAVALLGPVAPGIGEPLVVTARRDGALLGVASGWTRGTLGVLDAVVVTGAVHRQGIGRHLLVAFEHAAVVRGAVELVGWATAEPAWALLEGLGWYPDPVEGSRGREPDRGSLFPAGSRRLRRLPPRMGQDG